MSRLRPGDPVPSFSMTADDGTSVSSDSLEGRRYVLYFYPKDDTSGCTAQACGLRDAWAELTATGVEIYGVSPDSVESHVRFREKYGLPYRLLADEDHATADAFGVWIEKEFGGRRYWGTERTTFVIGPEQVVEAVLPQVKPQEHAEQLLAVIR